MKKNVKYSTPVRTSNGTIFCWDTKNNAKKWWNEHYKRWEYHVADGDSFVCAMYQAWVLRGVDGLPPNPNNAVPHDIGAY